MYLSFNKGSWLIGPEHLISITNMNIRAEVYIVMSVDDKLVAFLNESKNWERRPTNIPGVFLLKLPSSRSRQASIAIEINPVDATGSATKKRGIVIRSASELDEFNRILANQKLIELARKIDEVNPKQKEEAKDTGSDVFEI